MEKIQQVFNLGRNKMVALALLCGCDYDEGLNGVGKEAALKLFKIVEDSEVLERMKRWRTDSKFQTMEMELANPNICTNCGHPGKMRSHTKIGCVDCGTSTKCSDSYKEKRNLISNELTIRKKALLMENFPNQELIDEFLIRKGSVPSKLDLKWKKPMIIKFIYFMEKHVAWEQAYAFAKIFPLMTRWQLINLIDLPLEQRLITPGVFIAEKVKKVRNIRSVASYEILWIDNDNILEGLELTTPESNEQNDEEEGSNTLSELVTIEPQDLVSKCYPNIVEAFETLRNAKKKKPTRSGKKKTDDNGEEPVEKRKTERKKRGISKSVEVLNNKKIVEFINVISNKPTLEESFGKMSITPKRSKKDEHIQIPSIKKRGPQFDRVMTVERMDSILNGSLEAMFNQLTPEDFDSDVDNSVDMTIIIDNICKKKSNPRNILIEYQENIENSSPNIRRKDESFKKILDDELHVEYKENIEMEAEVASFMEHQKSLIINRDEEIDEFDVFDKDYVPLDQRLAKETDNKKNTRHSSTFDNDERFSLGIDSLLNGTD